MDDATTGARSLADRIAVRMLGASVLERVVIALVTTILTLLTSTAIVATSGYDAVEFISSLVYGTVGNVSDLVFVLRQSPMLILTGVAAAVAFRAGVLNIDVQDQFVVGGFAAALDILFVTPLLPNSPISAISLLTLATLLTLAVDGVYGALPDVMKAYAGVNEIVMTIMLNLIASSIVYFLLDAYLRPKGAATPSTEQFPDYVGLPGLVFESPPFSVLELGVALLTVVVVYLMMDRTDFGCDLITSGYQEPAAKYLDVDPKRMIVRTMTISGMITGLTGTLFVIMILGCYSNPNTFPTFSFDAVAVSLLTANNPLGMIPAGLLFGGLDVGGQYIGFTLDVPGELVDDVIGLIVLFVATPELFHTAGQHTSLGSDRK